MRANNRIELAIIRKDRSLIDRILIKLFPMTFKRFVSRHLSRSYEKLEISSQTLHSIDYYVGADCRLSGFGETGKKL